MTDTERIESYDDPDLDEVLDEWDEYSEEDDDVYEDFLDWLNGQD